MSESASPETQSSPDEGEDTTQLIAQLTAAQSQASSSSMTAPIQTTTQHKEVLIAPAPPSHAPVLPNATPLPKSLGGAFGAAQWAADARNRKPSQNGIVPRQEQQQPSTPANVNNGMSDLPKPAAGQGQYISPYYMDLGNGNSSTMPWLNQRGGQGGRAGTGMEARNEQTQTPDLHHQSVVRNAHNEISQSSSPWTPVISQAQNSPLQNEVATPGAATPAAEGDDSDSDTAEQAADGSTDPKYRNRNGSRQRLRHEDKINVIRTAIELFPKVKPRWRQLNDFWAQVGQVYETRYGKSVGKIRPMADRLIKIHRAYVERCEQIPGSIRDETSMTKTLDEWIALEDPLKAMSKTWQLSQHDVDGNRSWPTKKRAREDGDGENQPEQQRNGVDPSMRPIMPQSSMMPNNGYPPQPGFSQPQQQQQQQFQPQHSSFPPPPPPVYIQPNDPRLTHPNGNSTPQRPPPPPQQSAYNTPYPPSPSPLQALSSIEEAMKSLAHVMQREAQQPKPQLPQQANVNVSKLESSVSRLFKRLDRMEEQRKRDMDEIRGLVGEVGRRLDRLESGGGGGGGNAPKMGDGSGAQETIDLVEEEGS